MGSIWDLFLEDEDELQHMYEQILLAGFEFDDDSLETTRRGGNVRGRRPKLLRDRAGGHARIYQDYFVDVPVYSPRDFRRRFRMRKPLFEKIMEAVVQSDCYFEQKPDCINQVGCSPLQKCTTAIRMLAYGVSADAVDEYCRVSKTVAMESMKRFCAAVLQAFGKEFLRLPTKEEISAQMKINLARGFPGMFGSLDYMHWVWKNCPYAWHGAYQDREGNRSIILEAVCDQSLRIWWAFFGMPGSVNDITVIDRSPLVDKLLTDPLSEANFTINGRDYTHMYLLTDGIYPKWTSFVQTIHKAQNEKFSHYAKVQEGVRKDIERCFGVLQARWAIVMNPCRQWDMGTIKCIMYACVILHNMIIEDERDMVDEEMDYHQLTNYCPVNITRVRTYVELKTSISELEDSRRHFQLKEDLVEHIWSLKGSSQSAPP